MTSPHALTVDDGLRALDKGQYLRAHRILNYWAAREDGIALVSLGYLYDNGHGVRRSTLKAKALYRRAYAKGVAIAASNMATIYRDEGNSKAEFNWYQRAAEAGDTDALVDLGVRYLSGKGVARNNKAAIACFEKVLRSKFVTEGGKNAARQILWGCARKPRKKSAV